MKCKSFLLLITLIYAVVASAFSQINKRPNIILIMADDLGYSDLGCYGGEIETPNLDYLATNGIRFTQFYNTSRCCPSRASLLTGLYNHQAGIGEMSENRNLPGYQGHLGDNAVTIAEVLKGSGYNTAMTGKWHVSNTIVQDDPKAQLKWLNHQAYHPFFSPVEQYPTNRGFDKFFGTLWGVVDFFDPFSLVSGTTPVKTVPANYYHTDAINDTASVYIRDFAKKKKPFFLYIAENAPHWPLQAKPAEIEKYKNTYKAGWDVIREARYKKMVRLGIIDPVKAPLSERLNSDLKWEDNPDKEWDARAMAVHAAMVDIMDQGIGRIIKTLKETGQLDNTVILFLSDNGASPENSARYGPGFDRPGETRTGQIIDYPVNKKILPGSQLTFASIGPRWANVSNTPYRFAKEESYEGGVHTPLIAFYPKGMSAKKGSLSSQVGHVMDFMATVIDLSGAKYPEVYRGNSISPMEGISLLPAIKGNRVNGHSELFNEHFGARYVRSGDWKLVSTKLDSTWRLYQISKDQTEINNLSEKHPDKVKTLNDLWYKWANSHNVFPKPVKAVKK
ncbi:arylsulfatase [Daejeonella sp.]|uniref:arylsulfatase n=1 Tax=Daejeonella sp. TaxID=2805397 RepID=UPI0030C1ABCD